MYYTKQYGWVTRAEHVALIQAEHTFEKRHRKEDKKHEMVSDNLNSDVHRGKASSYH